MTAEIPPSEPEEEEAWDNRGPKPPDLRLAEFLEKAVGEPIVISNEFSQVRVVRVDTRNGARLLIESPKSGQWITLDPLELEAITWQNEATLSALVGNPFRPLILDEESEGEQK